MSLKTPLARKIAAVIGAGGAMPIGEYMALCLGDREHGYYMTRDPLGAGGDFTTAPEISQMFGELIGLWAADMWVKLGAPAPFHLVELGPGRGTLMADMARAARLMPAFMEAARIHLVETSPVLRARQQETLAAISPAIGWHEDIAGVPPGPAIFIANEFFDALPVQQFERVEGRWRERVVVLDGEGALAPGLAEHPRSCDLPSGESAPEGAIFEYSPVREAAAAGIAGHCASGPGAALIIDYGHEESGFGDTLQAVRAHKPAGLFDAPGEADLTAHVDFAALVRAAGGAGAICHGPMEMGAFLTGLGIAERATRLGSGKDAPTRASVDAALWRLTEPGAMGSLFKVLALTGRGAPPPEPFAQTRIR